MKQSGQPDREIASGQSTGRTLTFGLREAIVMALGGIAIAVAAALYLS
jgi:hypothetical protein